MWNKVFPDYAVKQCFHEQDVDRGDENIIVSMQSDLVSRILFSILKGALINCINKKRKFINERDIEIGVALCIFPFEKGPFDAGNLLDIKEFPDFVNQHIKLCFSSFDKLLTDDRQDLTFRVSQDTVTKLQRETEGCIRGFVKKMAMTAGGNVINYRHFDTAMSHTLADPSYMQLDQSFTFVPFA